jgi:RND family efflux transporter MFP subunit
MTRLWLVVAGLSVLTTACAHESPEEVESETVVTVTAAPAAVGTITATVTATGIVTPAPGAEQLVTPPEAARIVEMPKAEGDAVKKGDLLVRFEIPSLAADASKQRAEVARAQARLDNARKAQARAQDLFTRGVASGKEVEAAEKEIADAQADLESAEAGRTAADVGAARSVARAAFDGVIVRRMHNAGDLVEPGAEPVLRVIDPSRLEVTASVPIADVLRVNVGATAHVSGAAAGAPIIALRVVSRPAAVAEGTASVPLRLSFATPQRLPVGAPLQVEIDADVHQGVVVVPRGAVVREADESFVFVVADGKAERRAVTLGVSDDATTEIRSGVKAGDLVITSGQNGLPDGAKVTVAGQPESGGK